MHSLISALIFKVTHEFCVSKRHSVCLRPSPAQFFRAAPPPCWHPGQNYTSSPELCQVLYFGVVTSHRACQRRPCSREAVSRRARKRVQTAPCLSAHGMHDGCHLSEKHLVHQLSLLAHFAEWFNPPPFAVLLSVKVGQPSHLFALSELRGSNLSWNILLFISRPDSFVYIKMAFYEEQNASRS